MRENIVDFITKLKDIPTFKPRNCRIVYPDICRESNCRIVELNIPTSSHAFPEYLISKDKFGIGNVHFVCSLGR